MTTATEITYTPNLNDPRVLKKIRRSCGFVRAVVSKHGKDSPISHDYMAQYFGNYRNKNSLAGFLKDSLIICTDEFYSKDEGIAKSWTRNEYGYRALCKVAFGDARYLPDNIQEQGELEYTNTLAKAIKKAPIDWSESTEVNAAIEFAEEHFKDALKDLDNGTINYNLKSDRYFFSLQNIQRDVKKIILARHNYTHQYDIECCAPTLLYQYAQKLGMDEYLFAISRYLEDRTICREEVMAATGLSLMQTKKLITSMFSGAKLGANKRFTLFRGINFDYTLMRKIKDVPFIVALKNDISKMWIFFIKAGVVVRNVKVDKDTGKTRTLALTSTKKWRLYFRLERSVIDSVNRYLISMENKCFLEHDGWSATNEINQEELIAHIYKDTGFTVKLSYECISPEFKPLETLEIPTKPVCTLCCTEVFADDFNLLKPTKYAVFYYTLKNSKSQKLTWEEIAEMDDQNKLYTAFVNAKLCAGIDYNEQLFNLEYLAANCELTIK